MYGLDWNYVMWHFKQLGACTNICHVKECSPRSPGFLCVTLNKWEEPWDEDKATLASTSTDMRYPIDTRFTGKHTIINIIV